MLSNFIHACITIDQLSIQEVIDAYLSSCRRSKSSSSLEDDGKDSDAEDEDDPQTNQEFAEFKKWLDGATPSEVSTSQPVPTTCAKCGCEKCEWTSMKFIYQKIFQQNVFGFFKYPPWNCTNL